MTLECRECGGSVTEETCTPCLRRIKFYICRTCRARVPNPGYRGARGWIEQEG